MPSSWYFLKVILRQRTVAFEDRKLILRGRFFRKKEVEVGIRQRIYTYVLTDVSTVINNLDNAQRELITGYILRTPLVAGGRRYDSTSGKSVSDEEDVKDFYDGAEFIYDLDACVMAVRNVKPFDPTRTITGVLTEALGELVEDGVDEQTYDVHVGIMRDEAYTQKAFEKRSDLIEVRIRAVRPNPGPGHNDLDDLGDIADETDSDDIALRAKKIGPGSLAKTVGTFFRDSVAVLSERGYLSRLELIFRDRKRFNLGTANPTIGRAQAVRKVAGRAVEIADQAIELHDDLTKREDIYTYGDQDKA